MSATGEARLAAMRQSQPIAELERKWNKAKGRHSNAFWSAEAIDLLYANAEIMWAKVQKCSIAPIVVVSDSSDHHQNNPSQKRE